MTVGDWRSATITDLFDEQVRRRPEAVALRFDGVDMTYAELDKRAESLARQLRSLGVGTESVVGVFFERSFEMLIALVGILKAGGAYLPLHLNEPPSGSGTCWSRPTHASCSPTTRWPTGYPRSTPPW
ncbi:hypothetical protein CIK06_08780 [Plantactinospora sp. KBS50]|nr:hypothetical protein CIK06_08780 [Plantactinospora sp. KBS50]